MSACLVKAHNAGLFSLINKVITCAEIYDFVHVDFTGSYYSLDENLWNYLFEPTPPLESCPEPIIETVEAYPHQRYTAQQAAGLYRSKSDWRKRLNLMWHGFKVRPDILMEVDEFLKDEHRFIAVQVRAQTHAGEQITGRSQSLQQYVEAIEQNRLSDEPLFLLANNWETIDWFNAHYPCIWRGDVRRSSDRDEDFHLCNPQTIQDARDCLIDVLIASRARALIHPVSNMATAALYINPGLTSIYLP